MHLLKPFIELQVCCIPKPAPRMIRYKKLIGIVQINFCMQVETLFMIQVYNLLLISHIICFCMPNVMTRKTPVPEWSVQMKVSRNI